MGIFDIFKRKKIKFDSSYKFDFNKAPSLLDVYKKFREISKTASSLGEKTASKEKYENACRERDSFGDNVLAKEVWNFFNPISPTLYNADKEENEKWNKVFDKPFQDLSTVQRRFLVGLIERNYIYELPNKYYNK